MFKLFPVFAFLYLFAIVACYATAAASPRYRGPLIALGVVLTIPAVVIVGWTVLVIALLASGGMRGGF